MNQGRIWCVVNPSVGLPLLLGGVAVIALGVHTAVLTHTNWMSNYWAGSSRTKTSLNETTAPAALASNTNAAFSISVTPAADKAGTFVVTVTPNGVATAATDAPAQPITVARSE